MWRDNARVREEKPKDFIVEIEVPPANPGPDGEPASPSPAQRERADDTTTAALRSIGLGGHKPRDPMRSHLPGFWD